MLSRRRYIIKEHEFGIGTIASVAAKFGVHRRLVRQAIGNELPPNTVVRHAPSRSSVRLPDSSTKFGKLTARAPPQGDGRYFDDVRDGEIGRD